MINLSLWLELQNCQNFKNVCHIFFSISWNLVFHNQQVPPLTDFDVFSLIVQEMTAAQQSEPPDKLSKKVVERS